MPRPKSWYDPKDFPKAKTAAKERGHKLWKYTRGTREGKIQGYFVGQKLPIRLRNAQVEQK